MKDRGNLLGTMNELLVALDLMKRGYEVFHSMDGKTSCDLIILKDQCLKQVEVRTKTYAVKPDSKEIKSMRRKADILAVVVEGSICYYPPL